MFDAIDVSKWQGTINWTAVKNAGVLHAIIRAGYGNSTRQTDPQFKRNVTQCIMLGISWGVYWYSYATSPDMARQEARCCLEVIKGLKPTMPVAYDIEYEPGILALSNTTRTAMVKAFLEEVEAAGYYGILYASRDFITNKLNWKELACYDIWCAQYGSVCTSPLSYGIWQYSSKNPLQIPGFGSSLDCNRVYKDYPAIIQAAGLNGFTAPDPNPQPDLSTRKQLLSIGPLTNGDAWDLQQLCSDLGLTGQGLYHSDWADADKLTQTLTIGPISSGDAWCIMRRCEQLRLCAQGLYHSNYV